MEKLHKAENNQTFIALGKFLLFFLFKLRPRHMACRISVPPSRDGTHAPCSGSTGLPGQSLLSEKFLMKAWLGS